MLIFWDTNSADFYCFIPIFLGQYQCYQISACIKFFSLPSFLF